MQNPELVFPCHSGFVRNSYLALEGFHKLTLSLCLEGILLSNSSIEWLWTFNSTAKTTENSWKWHCHVTFTKTLWSAHPEPTILGESLKGKRGEGVFFWQYCSLYDNSFCLLSLIIFIFHFFTFNGSLCLKKIYFFFFWKRKITARGQKKVAVVERF